MMKGVKDWRAFSKWLLGEAFIIGLMVIIIMGVTFVQRGDEAEELIQPTYTFLPTYTFNPTYTFLPTYTIPASYTPNPTYTP